MCATMATASGSRLRVWAGVSFTFANGVWRSLVARLNGVQEAPGSNPGTPTTAV